MPPARRIVPTAFLLATCLIGACAAEGGNGSGTGGVSGETTKPPTAGRPAPGEFDRQFVIGPHTGQRIGYRFEWETSDLASADATLERFDLGGDSVFAIDSQNQLTRIRLDTGGRLWSVPAAPPFEHILAVKRVSFSDRDVILVFGEGAVQVLESSSGVQTGRQKLEKLASTEPVIAGPFLLYGSNSGQVIFHRYGVGYEWRANQLRGGIQGKPVVAGGTAIVASSGGTVLSVDLDTARQFWAKQLLDGVICSPAAGGGIAYVASLDQYLWALDLGDGQTVWKYFAKGPLTTSPVLLEGFVYQQLPDEGLACFEAAPVDTPDGQRVWTAREVSGEVIGRHRNRLLVWNAGAKLLTLVDAARGHILDRVELPNVDLITVSEPIDGDLFAASADGRLVRLSAR